MATFYNFCKEMGDKIYFGMDSKKRYRHFYNTNTQITLKRPDAPRRLAPALPSAA